MMATAARITIAEVEEIVEPGEIPPDEIITPGIYVNRIVKGQKYARKIERRTVRPVERKEPMTMESSKPVRRQESWIPEKGSHCQAGKPGTTARVLCQSRDRHADPGR